MGSIIEKNQRSTISCYCTFKAEYTILYDFNTSLLTSLKKLLCEIFVCFTWPAYTVLTMLLFMQLLICLKGNTLLF
jgi:hypothetical protein